MPNACGKRLYKTQRIALRAALGSSKSFGKGIRIYKCAKCKGYHLTSQPRNKPL